MKKSKVGNLFIPVGLHPEKHELATADVFRELGQDVEFLTPVRTKGAKTPDVKIDSVVYELKCPMGHSKTTIANAIRRAVKQSKNVIIDLRLTKISDERAEKDLQISIAKVKSLRRVKVILKSGKVLDLK